MSFRVLLLLSILFLGITGVFAQEQITLHTNKESFSAGDMVTINGRVTEFPNQLAAIEVKDPDNNTILIRTAQTDSNGNFQLMFKIPSSGKAGKYDIIANAEVNGESLTKTTAITSLQTSESAKSGGGCLLATATYGSEIAPQVQFLREIRDNAVLSTQSGTSFMSAFDSFYYSFSPTIADLERQNPAFKEIVKLTITPLLSSLSLLQYVDIDSEQEMLGYGIGIILLNVGMYFVVPAIIILKLRHKFRKI